MSSWYRRLSLRWKFLLPGILAIILGMGTFSWISYDRSREALERTVQRNLHCSARQLEISIASFFDDRKRNIQAWAQNPLYLNMFQPGFVGVTARKQAQEEFTGLLAEYRFFSLVGVADAQGVVLASSATELVDTSIVEQNYFTAALEQGFHESEAIPGLEGGGPGIVLTCAVESDGQVLGVLFAVVDLTVFSKEFVAPVSQGKEGFAFVCDSQGRVLAHPDPGRIMTPGLIERVTGAEGMSLKSDQLLEYVENGARMLLTLRETGHNAWIVAVTASRDELLGDVDVLRRIMIGMTFGFLVLLSGVIFFILQRVILRPLRQATGFMVELSRGVLGSERPVSRNADEMGVMTRAAVSVVDTLSGFVGVLNRIGQGDLSVSPEAMSEQDELSTSAVEMLESMNRLVSAAEFAANQMEGDSRKVAEYSRSLAQGSLLQAASLEQVGAAMEQIGRQTTANTLKSKEASKLSEQVKDFADKGGDDIRRMIEAMQEVKESGQAIARINKLVDEIAFQTNLLALNAAVEAARAGRHGKGFSVVAEEVRRLAGRSSKAARDISEIVKATLDRVERGGEIAEATSRSLAEIQESSDQALALSVEISKLSTEQSQGVNEVTRGMGEISRVTQTHTDSAELTAQASQSLAEQADRLKQALSRFTLRREE